jgi:hypothetical protein
MSISRGLLVATALASLGGCGTTATITRMDGTKVEAHITGGDTQKLYIEEDGDTFTVPRSEVRDVSHPGNAATIVGAILAGYGVLNIAVGAPMCGEKGAAFCTGVVLPELVGLPMLIWGIATHASSVSAAATPPSDRASIQFAPIVPVAVGQPAGAGIVGRF